MLQEVFKELGSESVVWVQLKSVVSLAGGRTLQILNAQQDSAGRYTCIATNEAGETLRHYEVKVYSMAMLSVLEICFCFAFLRFPHCSVFCPGEYKVSY